MSTVHHPSNANSSHHHEQVVVDYNEDAEEEIIISLQLGGGAAEGVLKQRYRGKSPTGSSCLLEDDDDEEDSTDDESPRNAKSISVPRRVSSCTVSSMPLLDDDSEEDTDEELQYHPRRLTRPKYDRSRLLSPSRSARIFDRYRPKNVTSSRSSRRNSSTATCQQRRYSHLSTHARDLLLDNGESFQAQLLALRECAGQSSEESDLGGSSSDFELSEDEGLAIANAAQRLSNAGKKRDTGPNRRATWYV